MSRSRSRLIIALLAGTALGSPGAAAAGELPTGGKVARGGATIGTPTGSSMTINQTTGSAIINWQGFSIGQGSTVGITQPGKNSVLLNRVVGSTTSTIAGGLTANGQVYLINPNGIMITPTGTINAQGFVASTLDTSDDDFMAGKRKFTGKGKSAAVVNRGTVEIGRGGYAALLGGKVDNAGVISVPLGRIGLGSGESATLDLSGDGFLQVAIPTAPGDDGVALVQNSGTLRGEGARIELRAATARELARKAINLGGVIEAKSVSGRSGEIILGGGEGGTVTVTGKLSARGAGKGLKGGKVAVTGRGVKLAGATIDASGDAGGGTVNIGGNLHGEGPLQNASVTLIDKATTITADATMFGNGGTIIVWSNDYTAYDGFLSARGGELGGDGGFAEVSGKATLAFAGGVDLTAGKGKVGTLLLDPYDVEIVEDAGGEGITPSDDDEDADLLPDRFDGSGTSSVIDVDDLEAALGSASVTVTTGDPDFNPDAGNITVNADIEWESGFDLILNAAFDVFVNQSITAQNGGLTLIAGRSTQLNAPIELGGTFEVTAPTTGGAINVTAADISIDGDIDAESVRLAVADGSSGSITFQGDETTVRSTLGDIRFVGPAGTGATGSLSINAAGDFFSNDLSANGALDVTADALRIDGDIDAESIRLAIAAGSPGFITFVGSETIVDASTGNVRFIGPARTNSAATGSLTIIAAGDFFSNAISAQGDLSIDAQNLTIRGNVRASDVSLTADGEEGVGLIRFLGQAVTVTSTIGDIELSGRTTAEGSLTLNAADDLFTGEVDVAGALAASAGNGIVFLADVLAGSIRARAGGDLELPGTMRARTGAIDLALASGSSGSIDYFDATTLRAATDVLLGSEVTGSGSLTVTAGGDVTTGVLNVGGVLQVEAGRDVTFLAKVDPTFVHVDAGRNLTTSGAIVSSGDIDLAADGVMTIRGPVFAGGDIVLNAGSLRVPSPTSPFDAEGRTLIYSTNWENDLIPFAGSFLHRYGPTFVGMDPDLLPPGDVLIYERRPTIGITATGTRQFGDPSPVQITFDPVLGGDGITGFVLGDNRTTAGITGAPGVVDPTGQFSLPGVYALDPTLGSLLSAIGYEFIAVPGTLRVSAGPLVETLTEPTAPWFAIGDNTFPISDPVSTLPTYGAANGGVGGPGAAGSGAAGGGGGDLVAAAQAALDTLEGATGDLQREVEKCDQKFSAGDQTAYIGCLGTALDRYNAELDRQILQLPPALRGISAVVREAAQRVRAAKTIGEARAAVSHAITEVRKAIALIRADDKDVARLQVQQGRAIEAALKSIDTSLARAVGI